jgi:hypothetical protein
MNLKLLIGLVLLGSLGTARADSLPELQSRCDNDAAVFFAWQTQQQDREARKPDTRSIVYGYENRYSQSMKGCFIVITTNAEWDKAKYGSYKTDLHRSATYMLFDVNTDRLLGTYFKERPLADGSHDSCDFGGIKCSSEAEWRAKIEPYVPGWRGA